MNFLDHMRIDHLSMLNFYLLESHDHIEDGKELRSTRAAKHFGVCKMSPPSRMPFRSRPCDDEIHATEAHDPVFVIGWRL
jgi:hypothetical protein